MFCNVNNNNDEKGGKVKKKKIILKKMHLFTKDISSYMYACVYIRVVGGCGRRYETVGFS